MIYITIRMAVLHPDLFPSSAPYKLRTYLLTKYTTDDDIIKTRLTRVSSRRASAAAESRRRWQHPRHCDVTSGAGNAAGTDGVHRAAAATEQSWQCTGTTSPRRRGDDPLSTDAALAPAGTSSDAAAPQNLRSTHTASSHEHSVRYTI